MYPFPCNEYLDMGHSTLVRNTKHPMIDTVNKIFIECARDEVTLADYSVCVDGR